MKICVAVTGASAVVLGQRVLENLREHEVHLIISEAAHRVIAIEMNPGADFPAQFEYDNRDISAPLASSSFLIDAMVVAPCSMKTLAGIAHGYSDNLILRSAENCLRLNRRLVLVPRETPLSLSAIENMRQAKLSGAIILPPTMAYYYEPKSLDDVTDFFVGKILDALGVQHHLFKRWQGVVDDEEDEMSLRSFVEELQRDSRLTIVDTEVDPNLELAGVIFALQGKPVLFPHVKREGYRVVSGVCGSRDLFALALGVDRADLVRTMARALDHPVAPDVISDVEAPCREVVEPDVDLNRLPILTHTSLDGGPYVTTGIVVVRDEEFGLNASFHRLMQIGPRQFTGRIIEGRGLHTAFGKSTGDLPVAICVGNSLPVLLAAAMSPAKGVNELQIANALQSMPITRCLGSDLWVPAETEIVLEGRLTHRIRGRGTVH